MRVSVDPAKMEEYVLIRQKSSNVSVHRDTQGMHVKQVKKIVDRIFVIVQRCNLKVSGSEFDICNWRNGLGG